ncbi:MAG: tetratricopeptide repeat protein [Holophagales bacterium]|jgi:predicted O-linked N-acetylglucosamine transferase (SPINDLY family)|nr:tetratricopeptide repeat protein [Holophagales bacterium]
MTEQNITELLERAKRLQNAGRNYAREAEELYKKILSVQPNNAEALHLYSLIAGDNNDWPLAASLLQRAVAAAPHLAFLHANLALAYRYTGQAQNAVNSYMRAIELDPRDVSVFLSLGNLLGECGKLNEAAQVFEKVIQQYKNIPDAYSGLGTIYLSQSLHQKALEVFSLALKLKPDYLNAMNGLGIAQLYLGLKEEAYNTFVRALGLSPESVIALNNLGILVEERRDYYKAYDYFSRAAIYKPDDIQTLNNLSRVSLLMYNPGKAREAIHAALKIDPSNINALRNKALEHNLSGELDSAIATFRKILSLAPQEIEVHSSMIFVMHYAPSIGPKEILDECRVWSEKYELPILSQNVPLKRDADPERKLRVGFVSPDLFNHPVGRSLLQLFAHRDNSQYDVYCYSSSIVSDPITLELQKYSTKWHNIKKTPDPAVADLIREDQIDILVDLSLHSSNTRLLVFAYKAAPIQMTYLGYPSTTGMKSMNYRISDRSIDPENEISQIYCEETLYLSSYWCYQEPELKIPVFVSALPALKNGFITFGCLNNISKISAPTIQCWTDLLKEIPTSKMLLYCPEGDHWDIVVERFTSRGIDKSRISLLPRQAFTKYFEAYREIDIALDPFPFGGGITTCDALWMGVPVVSLRGQTAVGRGGTSILSNIGMPGLIAHSQEEYISIAKSLGSDLEGLAATRKSLREKLEKSPVMDGKGFAAEMGQLFRQAWIRYCQQEKK